MPGESSIAIAGPVAAASAVRVAAVHDDAVAALGAAALNAGHDDWLLRRRLRRGRIGGGARAWPGSRRDGSAIKKCISYKVKSH